MFDIKKVIISDYYDGFSIDLYFKEGGRHETFSFNQEDDRTALKEMFEMMGVAKVIHQEVA